MLALCVGVDKARRILNANYPIYEIVQRMKMLGKGTKTTTQCSNGGGF